MTQRTEIIQRLNPHLARLRTSLADEILGLDDDSDAWFLLQDLVSEDTTSLFTQHFEQVGHALAREGSPLEIRIQALQNDTSTLRKELEALFILEPAFLLPTLSYLQERTTHAITILVRSYQEDARSNSQVQALQTQQIEKRLLALQRINGVSNSAIDLDQTLEVTAQVIAEELKVELCSIFFYDEVQRVLTLRATNGPRPLGGMHFTLRLGEGYSGYVADKGQPLLLRDISQDENFYNEAQFYGQDYRGLMTLPIIFFGSVERLIGVINVQSNEPREFTREEMSFVEVVTGIIAINMENGRLYEQTDEQLRRKVHELATIHRVSSIIASTLNLDEVLQIITTQAVHLSNAERSCIFELDPDRRRLQVLAHYGFNSAVVNKVQIGVGQCCAGRAVQTGSPTMAVDCFHADEHCFIHNDPFFSAEIHSVLCVPLKVKQKVLGCICIYSSHRHMLSPEQMQLVVTFANEAAIAIENARLYEETRRGLELKSVLLRELHHRVKNNLATVAGILSLQRRRTKSAEVSHTLAESVNRVQGLAATHDLLAHEDVSEARVDEIARKIVGVANAHLRPPDKQIIFQVKSCPVVIPSRAVTVLALVLNEMVSNAIKHGLKDVSSGSITIAGEEENGWVRVQVTDTGKGPGEDMASESDSDGLGLSLIKNLIADLNGIFSLRRATAGELRVEQEDPERLLTVAEVGFPLVRPAR